jgi:co-chaperonin GroES (HSP10)
MVEETVVDLDEHRKPTQLPEPVGYQLLIALPESKETTDGGVYMPDSSKQREEAAGITGMVLAIGPDAYKDETRFPSGPYCKKGDWIVMQPYTGFRMVIHKTEFRLINDDCVRAIVDDPRGVVRV